MTNADCKKGWNWDLNGETEGIMGWFVSQCLISLTHISSVVSCPLPSPPLRLSVALSVQPSTGIADFTVMHRPPAPLTRSVLNLYLRDVQLWLSSFCPSPLSHLSSSYFTWITISSRASPLRAWSCSMLLPVKMDLFPSTVASLRVRWKLALIITDTQFRCVTQWQ